jgi:uncharacterized protein (DUF2147 family)
MRHHAFAAALGLATAVVLAPCNSSQAASADPTGYWMKPDAERESKIQVFKCGPGKKYLCAKIAWLKNPLDSKGKPLHDIRNQNTALRGRAIVGLQIFTNLAPSAPSTWSGKIYNPEDGNTYTATLTVLSRKEIKLRGCKAWLLCGEKQWLRTSAPPADVIEEKPAEGEQIEASATPPAPPEAKPKQEAVAAAAKPDAVPAAAPEPATPEPAQPIEVAATPSVEPAVPALPSEAPAPQAETQAAVASAAPAAIAEPESEPVQAATPVALIGQAEAAAPPAGDYNWRQGYRFIQVSTATDTAAGLSGENVTSMFAMAKPIAADAGAPAGAEQIEATAAIEPVPVPEQKPKVKPKPVVAAAATTPKPAAKTAAPEKPAVEGAPAPQDSEAAAAEDGEINALAAETAEAAMAEEAPLSRREKRRLRRQHGQDAFLPWLR